MRGVVRLFVLVAIAAFIPSIVSAQGVLASMTGVVKDTSGAVLPGGFDGAADAAADIGEAAATRQPHQQEYPVPRPAQLEAQFVRVVRIAVIRLIEAPEARVVWHAIGEQRAASVAAQHGLEGERRIAGHDGREVEIVGHGACRH